MTRRAVILLNLGGPDSLDGVEPFLVNLFSDVISLPWGKFGSRFLGQLMARRRKERSQQLYRDIGGKSPILAETKAQAAALQAFLGEAYKVHIAMRYSSPTIDEIKSELKDQDSRLLHEMIRLLRANIGMTPQQLLSHFNHNADYERLARLSRLEHLLPADQLISEYQGAMRKLVQRSKEQLFQPLSWKIKIPLSLTLYSYV